MNQIKQHLKILSLTIGVFFIFSAGSFIANSYAEVTPLQVKQAYNNGVESSKKVCYDTGYDHRKNDQENFVFALKQAFAIDPKHPAFSKLLPNGLLDEINKAPVSCNLNLIEEYSNAHYLRGDFHKNI